MTRPVKPKLLMSWSSGKDSAWALHIVQQSNAYDIVGLLTTINEAFDRVAMHGVRRALLDAQADAIGLPLWPVSLPWPCTNEQYEVRMQAALSMAQNAGVQYMAFGDLFLEDIRDYRVRMLAGSGIVPLFPIWCGREGTASLAREMLAGGLRSRLTCVDPRQLAAEFCGREFDAGLLDELPENVDPCGENGEFHTFCNTAPSFRQSIPITVGETVLRDGFVFMDLVPD
jgi:uncharacterized protein (TIGR00290 family)